VKWLLCMLAAACSGEPSKLDNLASEHAFTITEVKPGVYHAVGNGKLIAVSNAVIIEGDRDLVVVDTHATPAAAQALRDEIKALTPKPVRFVVNTHDHFDHVSGNQIYGPDVDIISSAQTRQAIAEGRMRESRGYKMGIGGLPAKIADEENRLAGGDKAVETDLAKDKAMLAEVQRTHLTPPTITLTQELTLHRGTREIRIMFLGRGHTSGDVIVYLPAEKVVASGDLIVENTAYLGDGYFADWIETIEQLKKLDFDTVLPGHGQPFHGKDKLDHWQAYLRDFWDQAQQFHAAKVPWEEAAKQVDLRKHAVHYPKITALGITPNHGMARAYDLLDGTVK
jgi:cyclase